MFTEIVSVSSHLFPSENWNWKYCFQKSIQLPLQRLYQGLQLQWIFNPTVIQLRTSSEFLVIGTNQSWPLSYADWREWWVGDPVLICICCTVSDQHCKWIDTNSYLPILLHSLVSYEIIRNTLSWPGSNASFLSSIKMNINKKTKQNNKKKAFAHVWCLWGGRVFTMFLHIFERVHTRRQDEEHGSGCPRFFKGDGEVQGSAHHILTAQLLLHKVPEG